MRRGPRASTTNAPQDRRMPRPSYDDVEGVSPAGFFVELLARGQARQSWCGSPRRAALQTNNEGRLVLPAMLLSHALGERVAEDAVLFSRSVKIPNTCVKGLRSGEARGKHRFAKGLDH